MRGSPMSMRVLHKPSSWAGLVALAFLTGCFRPESIAADSASGSTGRPDDGTGNPPGSTSESGSSDETAGNGLPAVVAGDDRYYIEEQGQTLTVAAAEGLLVNDRDPNGGVLAVDEIAVIQTREGGRVQATADGGFTYTPPVNGWWGEDGFLYTVVANDGRSAEGRVRVVTRPQSIALAQVRAEIGGFALDGEAAVQYGVISVSGAGDVDGDGFADVMIGIPELDVPDPVNNDTSLDRSGRSYVVFGGESRVSGSLLNIRDGVGGFALDGEVSLDYAGTSVSGAGDINGDGLADVLIGARLSDTSDLNAGKGYVVYGGRRSSGSLSDIANDDGGFALVGVAELDRAGGSVSGVGDVDGDGLADFMVGAAGAGVSGISYVVYGGDRASGSLLDIASGDRGFALGGEVEFDEDAGTLVSGAMDVNGDGLADVVIGAFGADSNGLESAGRTYVVYGGRRSSGSLTDVADGNEGFALDGDTSRDLAGIAVSGAGDVNGDGLADLVIGASGADTDDLDGAGRSYVIYGGSRNSGSLASATAGGGGFALDGEAELDGAGISVSGAGDVNGDGYADLLIGAQFADPNGPSSGKCYVVYGRDEFDVNSLVAIAEGNGGFAVEGEAADDAAGRSVSGAGDVNGDGYADLLIGASGAESKAGRVYVVYGGDFTLTTAFPGTPADDIFVGSPATESIVGGLGNDRLESGGGRDTLYGGAGDDTLILPGTDFFRIDGGYGEDTLKVDGFLDLTETPNLAIKSIETIDITGSGNNSITLNRLDAFALTETRTLTIEGDMGDSVVIDLTDTDFERTDEGAYALLTSEASRFTLRLNRALDLSQVQLGSE